MKSGSLNLLEPSGAHWACYGTPYLFNVCIALYPRCHLAEVVITKINCTSTWALLRCCQNIIFCTHSAHTYGKEQVSPQVLCPLSPVLQQQQLAKTVKKKEPDHITAVSAHFTNAELDNSVKTNYKLLDIFFCQWLIKHASEIWLLCHGSCCGTKRFLRQLINDNLPSETKICVFLDNNFITSDVQQYLIKHKTDLWYPQHVVDWYSICIFFPASEVLHHYAEMEAAPASGWSVAECCQDKHSIHTLSRIQQ